MATPLSLTVLRLCRCCVHSAIHTPRESNILSHPPFPSRLFSIHLRLFNGSHLTLSCANRTITNPTLNTRRCCFVSSSGYSHGHFSQNKFYRTLSVWKTRAPLQSSQSAYLREKDLLTNIAPCCAGKLFTDRKHGFHMSCSFAYSNGHSDRDKGRTRREDIIAKQKQFTAAIKSRVADLSEDIRTVPNLLTLLRMMSAPVLGLLVIHEHFNFALGLFILAGITDLMDGYIARNFKNQKSVLGTMMDPLADKLLMTVLAVTLTMVDLIPVPLVALIISRDIGLIGAAFYIRYLSLPQPKTVFRYFDLTLPTAKLYPSNLSKVNTALQLSLVALTLAAPVFNYVDHPYLQALWYITALTTFTSGVQYVLSSKSFFKILQNTADKNNRNPKR